MKRPVAPRVRSRHARGGARGERWRRAARILLAALPAALAGCASTPEAPARAPVFYPAAPGAPRLQYLASFNDAADAGDVPSAFDRLVYGEDAGDDDGLAKPYGVAVHGGAVLAVDTRGARYAVFDLERRKLHFVRGDGAGRLVKPIGISVDTDGTRYVTDTARGQVVVFDAGDRYLRTLGGEGQFRPAGSALSGDRLYVTDVHAHRVVVLDKRTGETLAVFGRPGSGDGELFFPTNVAVGPHGDLYVSETGNFRVQRFTPRGEFVRTYGAVGSGPGRFARPRGVGVDREGRMYVADAAFENVQIFDPDGRLLLYFGDPGDDPGSLNLPAGLAVDYDNVQHFQRFAAPDFDLEYVVLVASQFGAGKVNAYGFGHRRGIDYQALDRAAERALRGDEGTR